MLPVRDALRPGVPGHSQAGSRGAGPPGMAGLRVHSSCPRRRGAGRAAWRRETDPVCLSETQSTVHKGGQRRGEGGCSGHGSSPHLRVGCGRNVHCAFLCCGGAGEFSTSGLGEGLSREALRGQDKQQQQQRGTEELDVSRRTVAQPSPGATFCTSPGCGMAPRRPSSDLDNPPMRHSKAKHVWSSALWLHLGWLQEGSYLSPAFGSAPGQFLPPPRSLQPPR